MLFEINAASLNGFGGQHRIIGLGILPYCGYCPERLGFYGRKATKLPDRTTRYEVRRHGRIESIAKSGGNWFT